MGPVMNGRWLRDHGMTFDLPTAFECLEGLIMGSS